MADFGYDVSDYCNIDPLFGSLEDFDRLVAGAHARRIKVILDFVPNHTSERHPWFLESRASRINPEARLVHLARRQTPTDRRPITGCRNSAGRPGRAMRAPANTICTAFYPSSLISTGATRPCATAMYDVLRFWLDRGVDGFRVDVIWLLIKDAALRDNPPNPNYQPDEAGIHRFMQVYTADQPETHEVIAEMRSVLDQYDERVLIGEIYLPIERLVTYYGTGSARRAPAVQFPAASYGVDRGGGRQAGDGLRRRFATRRLAELGAGQPRSAAHRGARRRSAGARCRDAAADAARHADNVLRRRARHRQSGHSARAR